MPRFACTAPNRLSIPRNSIAGTATASVLTAFASVMPAPFERRLCHRKRSWGRQGGARQRRATTVGRGAQPPSRLLRHVVGDLDLAGDDVGARLLQSLFHVCRDERPVVLVDRVADAAL